MQKEDAHVIKCVIISEKAAMNWASQDRVHWAPVLAVCYDLFFKTWGKKYPRPSKLIMKWSAAHHRTKQKSRMFRWISLWRGFQGLCGGVLCRMDEWEERQVDADLSICPIFFIFLAVFMLSFMHVCMCACWWKCVKICGANPLHTHIWQNVAPKRNWRVVLSMCVIKAKLQRAGRDLKTLQRRAGRY